VPFLKSFQLQILRRIYLQAGKIAGADSQFSARYPEKRGMVAKSLPPDKTKGVRIITLIPDFRVSRIEFAAIRLSYCDAPVCGAVSSAINATIRRIHEFIWWIR
jgi:hypothetical protein